MDGDVVLFNRQPSLHKLSIMAHQVSSVIDSSLLYGLLAINSCLFITRIYDMIISG